MIGLLLAARDAGFEEARVDRIFNRRLTDRQPAAVVRPDDRGRGGGRGPAGPGEGLAGRRALRRSQLGAVVGAHRRARHRPRGAARDRGTTRRPASRPRRRPCRAAPSSRRTWRRAAASSPAGTARPSASAASCCRAGRAGTRAGWGWAAEYVEAVDVVTAAGELVRASADENADLYWAARGAGPGFFGVVTRFHLRTLPRPAHVAQTVQAYDLDDFDEVMTWLHAMHASVADTVEIVALTKTDPRSRRPGAAGDRRRAGGLGRGGGRRPGAVPRPRRPSTARCSCSTPCRRPSTSSASGSCTTTPKATAGRSTTPGCRGPARRSCRRCAVLTRRCRTTRPSRSGSAWRRCGRCPTWRSRCSRRSTWRRTSRGSRPPTTSGASPGWRPRWPTWSR